MARPKKENEIPADGIISKDSCSINPALKVRKCHFSSLESEGELTLSRQLVLILSVNFTKPYLAPSHKHPFSA